jgi:SAM-dependent methyltransferase
VRVIPVSAIVIRGLLNRHGKIAFLANLPRRARLLDIGCGNASPVRVKQQRPDIYYVGLDVEDHNQSSEARRAADEYVLTSSKDFAESIRQTTGTFDAVLSAHNLEHCLDPHGVLDAMITRLKTGGMIYLSFPCSESRSFPHRQPTLNFFDDPTHQVPPDFDKILEAMKSANLEIVYARRRHRPLIPMLLGLALEPISALTKRTMPLLSTWALYGFESVIWARLR